MTDKRLKQIVREVIEKGFLAEFKNPRNAERISLICDELQSMHDDIVSKGTSMHEITMVDLQKCINDLRKIANVMM